MQSRSLLRNDLELEPPSKMSARDMAWAPSALKTLFAFALENEAFVAWPETGSLCRLNRPPPR
eukprot:3485612-Lingulodinium_polyedra.AAC.1